MQKNCFSYPVEFVEDVFGASPVLADVLKKVTGSENPKVLIVADMNVVQRTEGLGMKIGRYVKENGIKLAGNPVVIAGGEKIKTDNLQSVLGIVSAILSAKIGKNDVVLAIGGGTILDVAGYAAAQTRGGVRLVRLPTTPAAMIDAAFADYAAINSASVKDAMRVPSVPSAVVIDLSFAATVLDGVWRGGIGETMRLAVSLSSPLVKKLVKQADAYRNRDMTVLKETVQALVAVRSKKASPQIGLWLAHRLEAMSTYKLPHGYAVAIALCADINYAVEKGRIKPADRDVVVAMLKSCGAMDGALHSSHLIGQTENLLFGLDAWALATGTEAIEMLDGIGKVRIEEQPDRETLHLVLKNAVRTPPQA